MRYALIKAEDLTSAAFRGAEPVDRATWLCLIAWCYEHENGGRIAGARSWGDRRWQQTIAVTKAEVDREAAGLWSWDNDDLIVSFYDQGYVDQVHADSRIGAAGGRVKSEAKTEAARANIKKRWGSRDTNADTNGIPTTIPTDGVVGMKNDTNDTNQEDTNDTNTGRQSGSQADRQAIETASSPPPSPATPGGDGGAKADHPAQDSTSGARARVKIDTKKARQAVESGDVLAVVRAYGGNLAEDRPQEWVRDTQDMQIGVVAALFQEAIREKDPIREPSRFRSWREAFNQWSPEDRKACVQDMLKALGMKP